jgi:hypothetical protein
VFLKKTLPSAGFFIGKSKAPQKSNPPRRVAFVENNGMRIGGKPIRQDHLTVTLPPTSSMAFLRASASSLDAPSLTSLGSCLDQGLGIAQAQAGRFANGLENFDLGGSFEAFQDNVELGLFFSSLTATSSARSSHHDAS